VLSEGLRLAREDDWNNSRPTKYRQLADAALDPRCPDLDYRTTLFLGVARPDVLSGRRTGSLADRAY
jgi:hypothetical protein